MFLQIPFLYVSIKQWLYLHPKTGAPHFQPLGRTLFRDSRWAFSYSELRCWFSNPDNFHAITLTHISSLCCGLTGSKEVPAVKGVCCANYFTQEQINLLSAVLPISISIVMRWFRSLLSRESMKLSIAVRTIEALRSHGTKCCLPHLNPFVIKVFMWSG